MDNESKVVRCGQCGWMDHQGWCWKIGKSIKAITPDYLDFFCAFGDRCNSKGVALSFYEAD